MLQDIFATYEIFPATYHNLTLIENENVGSYCFQKFKVLFDEDSVGQILSNKMLNNHKSVGQMEI